MNRAHRRATQKGSRTTPKASRTAGNLAAVWCSNAPFAATGYSTQTAQVTRRMRTDGHSVAIAANYGLEGAGVDWEGVWVYPRGLAPYSEDMIRAYSQDWAARHTGKHPVVFTLYDVWVYNQNPALREIPRIYSWVPIDHQPCPPSVLEWCMRDNVTPIAMSKFGVEMLNSEGVECEYAPHAIEDVFQPTSSIHTPNGALRPRDMIGVNEDAFVVMMNSANKGHAPIRKAFGEAFLAFSIFASKHPDAVLYMHCEERTGMGGIDLPALAKACSIKPEQIRFVNQFAYRQTIPESTLAALYTTADVLLQPSRGEGFGIPAIEAQACGTRIIVSAWTAQPELAGPDSWTVGGQPEWDPMQGSWFFCPNVAEIVDALEKAYAAPRTLSAASIEFANEYKADKVYAEHWRPILERAAA
jgi:glycosyltransferase involved in cell wall biosynthesis